MASERYSYVLTEIAETDVEEILDYIAYELSNPQAASDFADALDEKLEEICLTPKAGRPVHNPYLKRDDVRRVLVKNYIAYYLTLDWWKSSTTPIFHLQHLRKTRRIPT